MRSPWGDYQDVPEADCRVRGNPVGRSTGDAEAGAARCESAETFRRRVHRAAAANSSLRATMAFVAQVCRWDSRRCLHWILNQSVPVVCAVVLHPVGLTGMADDILRTNLG